MATVVKVPAAAANLAEYCRDMARRAKAASVEMATLGSGVKIEWLRRSAALLRENVKAIEKANGADIEAAPGYGLSAAAIDR
jgi:glutamate-5-semialdehyde dehydrogenase